MNIKKDHITIYDNELLYGMWDIYQKSFPASEKRTLSNLRECMQGDNCKVVVYHDMGNVLGFIIYWEYPKFIYLEFFATNPEMRNNGLGSFILNDFIADHPKPIILEIDEMCDDLSKRRCEFYKRNGFTLNPFVHTPPAYNDKNVRLKMHIMTHSQEITQEQYDEFNDILINDIMANL